MNLRRRIVLLITALLAASCTLFALVSLTAFDRSLRADAHLRLTTLADAVGQIVDNHGGRLSLDAHDRQQVAALHGPEQFISVVDRHGTLIFGSRPPKAAEDYSFASTTRLDKNGKGIVTVWQSNEWIERIDRTLLLTFAAAGALLVTIGAFFARLLAERILRPVERVASLAESIEAHDLCSRIGAGGTDELSRLCASFDRMLDRLQRSFEAERRFVADASHELRTPLAILRAETDLALRRPRSVREYRDAFASVNVELARLESLLDDLLDTMRDRSAAAREDVHVGEVIGRVAQRVRPATRGVRVEVIGAPPVVRGHGEAIERAAAAVLHNAITHGGAGEIDVRIVGEEQCVRIDVADDGPGFADEALQHATERFWRADSARSRGGTGLGLSIARVLIEAHGGEIRLANGPEHGAIVSLVLPTT